MNTIRDLDLVLRDLEECAPDLGEVRRRLARELGAPPQRWRRFALPATAAAVVAAIATVTIVLNQGGDNQRPAGPATQAPRPSHSTSTSTRPVQPTPSPSPPARVRSLDLTWRFAVHRLPGYTIVRESIAADDQTARITVSGANKDIGSLDVYSPGIVPSNLKKLSTGHRLSVHGQHGYFAVTGQSSALIWEYGDGAWAEVSGDWGYSASGTVDANVAFAGELAVADAVDTTKRDPLRVDFTLGYVPTGLHLRDTIYYADPFGDGPVCTVEFLDDTSGQTTPDGTVAALEITRAALTRDTGQPGNTGFASNTTVGGRAAQSASGSLGVRYPDSTELTIVVDAKHLARYPAAQLRKIAERAAPVGKPSDLSTWATGNTAVPR